MKKFGSFIVGFVTAIISIVVGVLIFVVGIVKRGTKTMPYSTRHYIKSQFKFIDISKLKDSISNSIKAFVDWVIFARACDPYENHYDKNRYKGHYNKDYRQSKEQEVHPDPYFIDEDEYGCGSYEVKLRYDVENKKLYDDYFEAEVLACDFIKDMLKNNDSGSLEIGNVVYIHDPSDGGDYMIEMIEPLGEDKEDN